MRSGALARNSGDGKGIAVPKYDRNRAKLVHRESGEEILPGSTVPDFRGDLKKFLYISRLPEPGKSGKVIVEEKVGGEYYPSVLEAEIVIQPRWRVMCREELIGRAEQWSNDRNVLDTSNPKSVSDFQYLAMGTEWSHTGSTEIREVEPGIQAVYAIREPWDRDAGYKHEDTGIRIVDAWQHGQ